VRATLVQTERAPSPQKESLSCPRTPVLSSAFGVVAALAATLSLPACGGVDPTSVDDALLDVAPAELEIEDTTCPEESVDYSTVGETFDAR